MTTLYRKYRPQTFSGLSGQSYIVKTLQGAVLHNRIGHAYLFTGPRGTGKTTTARLFAKTVNCQNREQLAEPCNTCDSCTAISTGTSLNVIEIDAASNTGVDNIRQLREEIRIPPSGVPWKIYIIDEVHMLSSGAFNALLKVLEEPPKHALFIMATTELHKVPETIISRCQRFDFSRIEISHIIAKLENIAASEGVIIDTESLEMIAIASEGGMRDAESLLSQIIALEDKNITSAETEEILGLSDRKIVARYALSLVQKNIPEAFSALQDAESKGCDFEHFSKSSLLFFRRMLLLKIAPGSAPSLAGELTREDTENILKLSKTVSVREIVRIIDELLAAHIKIKNSFIPQLPLESSAVKLCSEEESPSGQKAHTPSPQQVSAQILEKNPPTNTTPPANNPPAKTPVSALPQQAIKNRNAPISKGTQKQEVSASSGLAQQADNPSSKPILLEALQRLWPQFLRAIQEESRSLSTFLINCRPARCEHNMVDIETRYAFYKDTLEDDKNRLTMETILSTMTGSKMRIRIILSEQKNTAENTSTSNENPALSDVLEVFGSAIEK